MRRREAFDPRILRLLVWSILFTIVSELAFTFYVSVYDLSNLIGHYFKIFAFYLVYKAIIVTGLEQPYSLLLFDVQKQREELQVIIDASPILIFYKDRENRFIRVSKALAEAVGLPKQEIEGKTGLEIYPNQVPDYWEDDKEVIASGIPKRGVVRQFEMAGGMRWIQTDKIPYRDNEGRIIGVIGFGIDITERKQMEEEIRELSFRDPLTALYNRRGFITLADQQLKGATRVQRKMLLAFLDVDHLKWINDTVGHEAGDKALVDAAEVLRRTFRESDIIARVGGDEFAVLAIDMTDLNPELLPNRLQHTIDAFNTDESKPYRLSLSWGMTVYEPGATQSLDQLMSAADALMYAQKKAKYPENLVLVGLRRRDAGRIGRTVLDQHHVRQLIKNDACRWGGLIFFGDNSTTPARAPPGPYADQRPVYRSLIFTFGTNAASGMPAVSSFAASVCTSSVLNPHK